MRVGTPVLLRFSYAEQPLYACVTGVITDQYVSVVITAPTGKPGWRKGSHHLVPSWRLSRRPRGKHRKPRRRWWR